MYKVYTRADELPGSWDKVAQGNYALQTAMLRTLEQTNPCNQRYVAFYNEGALDSLLVTYELKLDVLSFSTLSLKLQLTIVGIPCSVAQQGYVLGSKTKNNLERYLNKIKGSKLIINSAERINLMNFTQGVTLPSCIFTVKQQEFSDYLRAIRSHYRYRYKKALKKGQPLVIHKLKQITSFDGSLYQLYEQVYERSSYKLEKLTMEFFQQITADIYVFKLNQQPLAFVQLKQVGNVLHFLFGGLDYSNNSTYDLYINMLLLILDQAMQRDCAEINFGQTAEDAKLKLGSTLETKYLYVSHSNPILRFMIKKAIKLLSYQEPHLSCNVFKEDQEKEQ